MNKAQRDALKCRCGAAVSLYFSGRLNRYVCPVCLEAEVLALTVIADKSLEHWKQHRLPWLLKLLSSDPANVECQTFVLEDAWVAGRYDYMVAAEHARHAHDDRVARMPKD